MSDYRLDIDILKGIAIIAVVLYHLEILSTGYLGVDVFFVINGFFILPSVIKKIDDCNFSYSSFLYKRVMRLLPVLVIACYFCFLMGYWGMLPNDLDKLCASIIATEFFSNNLLSLHSIENYWDTWNCFKPLMHTWYLGVLFEFYLIIPLPLLLLKRLSQKIDINFKKTSVFFIVIIFFFSLCLYFFSTINYGSKFYLLQYRLYELLGGGLIGVLVRHNKIHNQYFNNLILLVCVTLLLLGIGDINLKTLGAPNATSAIGAIALPATYLEIYRAQLVVMTVITTMIILLGSKNLLHCNLKFNIALSKIGRMSFSIFVWHQVLIAFFRYYYSTSLTVSTFVIYIISLVVFSYVSYTKVETVSINNFRKSIIILFFSVLIMIPSVWVYLRGGIIRDIPELGLYESNSVKGQNLLYCDRINKYDRDFSEKSNKTRVLIAGNSFARDFANILLESNLSKPIELSYMPDINDTTKWHRIKKCDFLFCFYYRENIPDAVLKLVANPKNIYGIGTKNFGESNGVIYTKRIWLASKDYFSQSVSLPIVYEELNKDLQNSWKNNYIDLIECIRKQDGTIPVFTPEGMFISQDCRHLTPAGAKFYASIIDFTFLKQ